MLIEPTLEFRVVVKLVLMGDETELSTASDIRRKIVDVESVFGNEGEFVDRVLVEFGFRFDGTDFV